MHAPITDDTRRLLRLISLVGWTSRPDDNKCGLRHRSEADAEQFRLQYPDVAGALHMMTSYYAGSVAHHEGVEEDSTTRDTYDLPRSALAVMSRVEDTVLALLGRMVVQSLGIPDNSDHVAVATTWRNDVVATCWRVLLDSHQDRFAQ